MEELHYIGVDVSKNTLDIALTTCRLSSERLALRQQEVAAAEKAYEVSKDVMQNSSSTYLKVLTAQQSLLQSRLTLTTDHFDLIQGKINLFKALGGENIRAVRMKQDIVASLSM